MATFYNTYNGKTKESEADLGYPWIPAGEQERPPSFEFGVRTADAILADVGDDPVLAQQELDRENSREFPPRKVLSMRLQKIIRDAES